MAKKRKVLVVPLVPRRGPATNLRPGGVHEDGRRKTRSEQRRAALLESAASAT